VSFLSTIHLPFLLTINPNFHSSIGEQEVLHVALNRPGDTVLQLSLIAKSKIVLT
jgi:hypothetical protein